MKTKSNFSKRFTDITCFRVQTRPYDYAESIPSSGASLTPTLHIPRRELVDEETRISQEAFTVLIGSPIPLIPCVQHHVFRQILLCSYYGILNRSWLLTAEERQTLLESKPLRIERVRVESTRELYARSSLMQRGICKALTAICQVSPCSSP